MFCPNCEAEYREGITRCADCEVELVAALPPEPEHPKGPFVVVFSSADASLLPVVESLLIGAEIPFSVQGEESALGLFPFGPAGGTSDSRRLGAVIRVPEEHAEAAKALLAEAEELPDYPASEIEPE